MIRILPNKLQIRKRKPQKIIYVNRIKSYPKATKQLINLIPKIKRVKKRFKLVLHRRHRRIERTPVLVEEMIAIDKDDGVESVDYPRNVTEQSQNQTETKFHLQLHTKLGRN